MHAERQSKDSTPCSPPPAVALAQLVIQRFAYDGTFVAAVACYGFYFACGVLTVLVFYWHTEASGSRMFVRRDVIAAEAAAAEAAAAEEAEELQARTTFAEEQARLNQ